MRLLLLLGLCLTALIPSMAAAHYTHGVGDAFALVRVEEEAGATLQSEGLFLVAEVPEGYLAFIDAHELDHLRAEGISVAVLVDKDNESLEYLIAYDHEHEHPLADPHPAATTLYRGEGYRVMSLPSELMQEQPSDVPEIVRIYRRPLSFVSKPWTEPPLSERTVVVDPEIAAAISDIVQAPLQTKVQTLQDFVTRHSQRDGGLQASFWIRDQFLSYGYTDVSLHSYNSWNDNVVCVKPGAVYPDEIFVIGAHYDSINPANNANAPGADDNASGSVAVMEVARVLADVELERTIVFICFSGEEEGLVGSDAWAEQAANSGMNLIGMVNLDMICYRAAGDSEDLDIIANGASEPMAELAFEAIDAYVPELNAVEGFLTSGTSDHASFWAHGFRAIFLFEDSGNYSPYIHTANDRVGNSANDFAFMTKNVKAVTAVMAVLARPFHVAIAHDPLGNSEENGPFPVLAQIDSAEPLDSESLELRYRINGGSFATLPLAPSGQQGEYIATIPVLPNGSRVEYYLSASDVEGYTATSPEDAPTELYSFRTGVSLVLIDDAEVDQGWALSAPGDDADTGHWIRDNPVGTGYQPEDDHTPGLGTRCFVTGNAPAGSGSGTNDVDGGRTTLLSPVFDLDGATWAGLSYWRWYALETSYDDDFQVDISNDAGGTWHVLETVSASAYPWVKAEFDDLAAVLPLTGQMRLRFIARDTGQGSLVEAAIDDFEVVAIFDDPADAPESAIASAFTIHPSPFYPSTSIRFTLPQRGKADLRIYDITGAEVARPVEAVLEAGSHATDFDGTGLASGIYLARLWLDGQTIGVQKMTLIR